MLKKEFFDAFKKFMECMILLLGIPLGVVFDKLIIHYGWKLSEIRLIHRNGWHMVKLCVG